MKKEIIDKLLFTAISQGYLEAVGFLVSQGGELNEKVVKAIIGSPHTTNFWDIQWMFQKVPISGGIVKEAFFANVCEDALRFLHGEAIRKSEKRAEFLEAAEECLKKVLRYSHRGGGAPYDYSSWEKRKPQFEYLLEKARELSNLKD